MLQRKNKKGFTLAELLIVVAILAVLTAIAVPLFVGGISDAKKATGEANVRSVRGAAVVTILENQDTYMVTKFKTLKPEDGTTVTAAEGNNYAWYVTADVSSSGDISNLKINAAAPAEKTDYAEAYKTGYEELASNGGYRIAFKLTELKAS